MYFGESYNSSTNILNDINNICDKINFVIEDFKAKSNGILFLQESGIILEIEGDTIWEKFKTIIKKIKDFFVNLWKKFIGLFKKNEDEDKKLEQEAEKLKKIVDENIIYEIRLKRFNYIDIKKINTISNHLDIPLLFELVEKNKNITEDELKNIINENREKFEKEMRPIKDIVHAPKADIPKEFFPSTSTQVSFENENIILKTNDPYKVFLNFIFYDKEISRIVRNQATSLDKSISENLHKAEQMANKKSTNSIDRLNTEEPISAKYDQLFQKAVNEDISELKEIAHLLKSYINKMNALSECARENATAINNEVYRVFNKYKSEEIKEKTNKK